MILRPRGGREMMVEGKTLRLVFHLTRNMLGQERFCGKSRDYRGSRGKYQGYEVFVENLTITKQPQWSNRKQKLSDQYSIRPENTWSGR